MNNFKTFIATGLIGMSLFSIGCQPQTNTDSGPNKKTTTTTTTTTTTNASPAATASTVAAPSMAPVAGASAVASGAPAAAANWQTYNAPDSSFSFDAPDKIVTEDKELGQGVTLHLFHTPESKTQPAYLVAWMTIPAGEKSGNPAKAMMDGTLKDHKVINRGQDKAAGQPAEVAIADGNDGTHKAIQSFVVGDRCYEMMVVTPAAMPLPMGDVGKFMNSVKANGGSASQGSGSAPMGSAPMGSAPAGSEGSAPAGSEGSDH